MTEAQATVFIERALEEIRSGTRDTEIRSLVKPHGLSALESLPLITRLQVIRLAADLFDRSGEYDLSLRYIEYLGPIEGQWLVPTVLASKEEQTRALDIQQCWCALQAATSLHRQGRYTQGLTLTRQVLAAGGLEESNDSYELLIRANYMAGRMTQSVGEAESSEDYFRNALGFCSLWKSPAQSAAAHARYQTAVALTGLARSAIELGHFHRALGQLRIASTLLRESKDELTQAYVTYLIGSILRQTGDLGRAIEHLDRSRAVFLREKHGRLFARCSLELAHAYLNDDDTVMVRETLKEWAKDRAGIPTHQSSAQHASESWEAIRLLLDARVLLKHASAEEAQACARRALQLLTFQGAGDLGHHVAVANAILADALLAMHRYDEAIRSVAAFLATGTPGDPTDHAWLLLVRAEAYLARKANADVSYAHIDLSTCRKLSIENRFIKARLDRILSEIELRIGRSESDLRVDVWESRLHKFLISVATQSVGASDRAIAELLECAPSSVRRWREEPDR